MHYFEGSSITHICVHKVGNQSENEYLTLSKKELAIDVVVQNLLAHYFLKPFKSEEYFQFFHDSNLSLNEVWTYASAIFEHPEQTLAQSKHLAQHLYNQSTHPNIKGGEFYVVYFKDCQLHGEACDAIGLFKSERKETFLKILPKEDEFEMESEEGININKLDKGCIIFNAEKESGFIVSVVDNTNKSAEARYWTDEFLHIQQRQDQYFNTQNKMALYKTYVVKQLPEEYNVTKADQADLLNRTLQFFKENQHFDQDSFNTEVLHHKELINGFEKYKKQYEGESKLILEDNFPISPAAVKKQNRIFKSIIKLDKNFHIYIHGDRNRIEHGEDEKGRYYKLYFNTES
ncbi:MAG TPA: nucleoid-associated protein [Niabella sp.]|nr:nucleoid-associated protein [Niabella sp.]HOZ97543.1 nucleoid-associated protein [Niabella sp.]HQW15631.1 nucleoid-associated protein [Niabella sp.]HQX20774.1 nucleoid-associated protein [Niabella sp.]HQX41373.1 nucleoid-associated protein [Niabella sp.]